MSEPAPITITAFKWVPPFAQGQVRDHRLRWALKEVGWSYEVELIDPEVQKDERYLAEQPFGQVPVLREQGRPALFETGAILLDIAERSGRLLPQDDSERALAKCWLFAALNSVEPFLQEVALTAHFVKEKQVAEGYRKFVMPMAQDKLAKLSRALDNSEWLVGGEFSIADLLMSSVTKVVHDTNLLNAHENLVSWRDRCFARPAYRQAIAEQCAVFEKYSPEDMGDKPLAESSGEE